MKRAIALLPLVLFVVLIGLLAWYNFHKKETYQPRAMVGKSVPSVALSDLDDGSTADLKAVVAGYNRPVLVNMFASWCVPCEAENPQLMALKAQGVPVIGIAWKDDPKATQNFLNQHGDPYVKTLSDPDGKMALALGVSAVPETFFVKPDGTITDKISEPIVPDAMDAVLKEVRK